VGDERALAIGLDQRSDQIELVQRDELENFIAHFALRIAGQGVDDLQMLGADTAEKIAELAIVGATLDEGIEAGARAPVGKGDNRNVADARSPRHIRCRVHEGSHRPHRAPRWEMARHPRGCNRLW